MFILYAAIEDTLYDNAKESAFSVANSIYIALDDNIFNSAQLVTFIGNDPYICNDLFHNELDDTNEIQAYLKNIKSIYSFDIVHMASFDTNHYYSQDGLVNTFDKANPKDKWFFELLDSTQINTGYQPIVVNDGEKIIFNNIHMLKDSSGIVKGFILIGLDYSKSLEKIKKSINALNASVYIVNANGEIQSSMFEALNDLKGNESLIEDFDMSLITSNSTNHFVQIVQDNTSISFKYIKEVNSYLVITQDLSSTIFYTFIITLLIITFLLACILLITLKIVDYSNRKILDKAALDPLTNIYNRSVFNIKLSEAIELCFHYNIVSSFIFIDIDNFKMINDEMGHAIGDEIIVKVARLLEDSKRKNDILFRWGGDEFGLIVRSNLENTLQLAQRILNNSHEIFWKEGTAVSLSIGVTEILSNDSKKLVFNRVDDALYHAKANGKNQIYSQ
jgi:diguanylate cyclase (GGDEF)-like protein